MPLAPAITLTATLQDTSGTVIPRGQLRITLCGYTLTLPKIIGTTMLAKVVTKAKADSNGKVSVPIWGNDLIDPQDTFYCIEIIDADLNVVQAGNYLLTGTGSQDLSTLQQIFPTPPLPPLPPPPLVINLLIVAYNANLVISGAIYTTFEILLTGDVASITWQNLVAGNIYTIIWIQDGPGNHAVAFASNTVNASAPDTPGGSITVQSFIATSSTTMSAIGNAMYQE